MPPRLDTPSPTSSTRRGFEFLFVELSLALERLVPRYPLWLGLQALGWDPMALTGSQMITFCDRHLEAFLAEHGLALAPRRAQRLRREIRRFDPRHPTPYETMERLVAPRA